MSSLTAHQKEALANYRELVENHPGLFDDRFNRPIVLDFNLMESYAIEHNVVLGVAAKTPFVYFLIDLVKSQKKDRTVVFHPYLRVVSVGQLKGGVGVVVLATTKVLPSKTDKIIFLSQERHSTGLVEIELPRGFGEKSITGENNALKELREETGYVGKEVFEIGSSYADTGLTDSKVNFYCIPLATAKDSSSEEAEEAIVDILFLSLEEAWNKVDSGCIRDGFTIQALALYERWKQSYKQLYSEFSDSSVQN